MCLRLLYRGVMKEFMPSEIFGVLARGAGQNLFATNGFCVFLGWEMLNVKTKQANLYFVPNV